MSMLQTTSTPWRTFALVALLPLAVFLAGCDDENLMEPEPTTGGDLFDRYVALGNSITAGFQSGGINASLQKQSYAFLLSQQMGTEFRIPAMNEPGCPPPLTSVFPTQERLADGTDETCALRDAPTPVRLNNVAVPGAEVLDATTNLADASNANALTTFILGGRTQVEAATEIDPTFATVWIGNNDVLSAALAGTTALITPTGDFETRYEQMLDSLDPNNDNDLQGGVLFGVADPTLIPALSAGAAYSQAIPAGQEAGALPPNLQIADSCAPSADGGVGDQMLVPFQYGATALGIASGLTDLFAAIENAIGQPAGSPPDISIDCGNNDTFGDVYGPVVDEVILQLNQQLDALEDSGQITTEERNELQAQLDEVEEELNTAVEDVSEVSLLQTQEIAAIGEAVQAYNAFIQAEASERGYAYLDPNQLFVSEDNANQIPPFPELIDNPETPFGPLFSLDGVHPSAAAHQAVTNALVETINAEYGTSLQPLSGE